MLAKLKKFPPLRRAYHVLKKSRRRAGAWLKYAGWRTVRGFQRKIPCPGIHSEKITGQVFIILAGVPLDDTGGGSRAAQLSLELLAQGFEVIYVFKYPKWETIELNLALDHPRLTCLQLAEFQQKDIRSLVAGKQAAALMEIPLPEFAMRMDELQEIGVKIIYDLVDDWDTALGGQWFNPFFEREIARRADVLLATAPQLAVRLERMTGHSVNLLPNAYNPHVFNNDNAHPRPSDLPQAEWHIIYTGALYGPWFDWDLLAQVARAFPRAAVVVIGDYRGQCPHRAPNLHFLGLKAQRDLPGYLQHSTVAIIPWKVDAITLATSPLKVYEYLAMGKPVVCPDLPLLREIPFVYAASGVEDFIRQVEYCRTVRVEGAAWRQFLAENNWQARVKELCRIAGIHP